MKLSVKTARTMKVGAISGGMLAVGILTTLSLHQSVQLVSSSVFSINQPNNKVLALNAETAIAGVSTMVVVPVSRNMNAPVISAAGAIVQDVSSGTVLYAKNEKTQVPIASTTKIMTALVGAEYYKPNSVLTVTGPSLVDGSNMGLRLGEQLSFRSLLYGMMLNSGNDAAYTIAANYPGGINAFVTAMNEKAAALGLTQTHFENPAGFDSPSHHSSAADLAKLAMVAEANPQIARVVSTKETEVASLDKSVIHSLKNLNQLLGLPGVLGMKTGYTPAAKENLVGLVERDEHVIVTVVLGSNDRFGESKKLMDWTFQNYSWGN